LSRRNLKSRYIVIIIKQDFMTNRFLILLSITLLTLSGANAQLWKIDPNHSSIMFNAKHSGISFVNGRFMQFQASVAGGTPADFTGAKVTFTAQVSSVSTGAEGRDEHLKSDDFFDMGNHPTIDFTSKSFIKSGGNTYEVIGDLTMRGNTKEVTLTANHIGSTKTKDGLDKVGFQLFGSVDRNDFGVSGAVSSVAPIIEILCNVEMSEQN
jgi:polyisoprenoid-binding protein YceI